MKNLRPEMSISEILEKFPETKELFIMNGLGTLTDNKAFIATLTLDSFAKMRELNSDIFFSLLEKCIDSAKKPMVYTEDTPPVKPDFLGYIICPVKQLVKDTYEAAMQKHFEKTGEQFVSFIPMGCGGSDPYEDIWQTDNIDELPDIICSMRFGDFYRSEFTSRFIDKGFYKSDQLQQVAEPFASAGIPDPQGNYFVYGVSLYVMLVDRKKLKDLPVPSKWRDLLNPIYENNIIVSGGEDYVSDVLLMNLWKDYGDEGLEKFLPNIKERWHSSQMAKAAGSSMAQGAAIYILPWFFASTCPNVENTEIIWPEDGALASPMYMLAKKSSKERLKVIYDFITGKELADIMSDSFFPSLHPDAKNHLPEGAKIKWLGWDFIKNRDMKIFSDGISDSFVEKLNNFRKTDISIG